MTSSLNSFIPSTHTGPVLIRVDLSTFRYRGTSVCVETGRIFEGTKSGALEIIKLVTSAANAALMLPKLHYREQSDL